MQNLSYQSLILVDKKTCSLDLIVHFIFHLPLPVLSVCWYVQDIPEVEPENVKSYRNGILKVVGLILTIL